MKHVKKRATDTSGGKLRGAVRADRVSELEAQLCSAQLVLEAFRDIASALSAPVDSDRLLGLVLGWATRLLDAERATLFLIDDKTGELVSQLDVGGCEQTIRLAVGQGIAGNVVQTGKPIRVDNAYEDRRFNHNWDRLTGYRTQSILAVPMKNNVGQSIGVLQVLNKTNGLPFSEEDEGLLSALASHAAVTIDNFKLYLFVVEKNIALAQTRSELERKVDFLHLLFKLESAMARASDLRQLVHVMLSMTVAVTKTSAGAALLVTPAGPPHQAFVFRQHAPGELSEYWVDKLVGTLEKTIEQAGSVLSHNVRGRSKATSELQLFGLRARSILSVPMLSDQGAAIGALVLYDREDGSTFSDDDRELLRLVAANASTAISLLRSRESQRVSDRLSTIGSLLSSVLHDLKTPMAVISGYVQLMAATDSEERRREYSELVLRQFEYITAMQREVLAFARGERTILISKVYIQSFFEEFRTQFEREIEGRGVTLELELRDRGVARIDKAKVTRALHNLARNAVDAMRFGGILRIVVERDGRDLLIRVGDTGPGIPDRVRGTLFDSFVSAEKVQGTGLGLAIVKTIAEEHGGSVDVVSSPKGAEFTLRFPQG